MKNKFFIIPIYTKKNKQTHMDMDLEIADSRNTIPNTKIPSEVEVAARYKLLLHWWC